MKAKRIFDFCLSLIILIWITWFLIFCFIICSIETKSFGFFLQTRIGQFGRPFKIFKLKTMQTNTEKVTSFGRFFRKYKIDELPQFFNVLIGNMSIVGPRPDVKGYYDKLEGEERKILNLKPGITSLASIKYSNEDTLLSNQANPLEYNDRIIFPDKVKMNLDYYYHQSFFLDLKIIFKTMAQLV
ncbi:sugar transferase [Flavobacterium sp.]